MKLVLAIIGSFSLIITLIAVLIPYYDLDLRQYNSLPEKSLRTGIEDCIVSEEGTNVGLNIKCWEEELTPNQLCGGQQKGSMIWISKLCIFNEPSQTKDEPQIQEPAKQNQCTGTAGCYTDYITRIVDGDTIHTATKKIRLSLTNTPETYQAGFNQATEFTKKLCPVGSKIIIDQDDLQRVDQYGRILAKVFCGDKILNSELLYNGHANILTAYCNTSEFSKESWAIRYGCETRVKSEPITSAKIVPSIPKDIGCDPSYPDVCIETWPPDLDCVDISFRNFRTLQPDPHGFDRDLDGIGCES